VSEGDGSNLFVKETERLSLLDAEDTTECEADAERDNNALGVREAES